MSADLCACGCGREAVLGAFHSYKCGMRWRENGCASAPLPKGGRNQPGYRCRNPRCTKRASRQGNFCSPDCKATFKRPNVDEVLDKLRADDERDPYPVETSSAVTLRIEDSAQSHGIILERCPHCGRSAVRETVDVIYPAPGVRRVQLRCSSRTSKFAKHPCPVTIVSEEILEAFPMTKNHKEETMKLCKFCESPIESEKPNAQYCSVSCSAKANWEKRRKAESVTPETGVSTTKPEPAPITSSAAVRSFSHSLQGLTEDQIQEELRETPEETRQLLDLLRGLSMDSLCYLLHLESQRRDVEERMMGLCRR